MSSRRAHIYTSRQIPLGISLAQQLAQLDQPAPADFDPEDTFNTNNAIEDANEDATSAGREHYLDVGPSSLRSEVQEGLTDPKYDGIHVSRKQMEQDDNDESDDLQDDAYSRPVTIDEEDLNSGEENDENAHSERATRGHASEPVEAADSAPKNAEANDLSLTLKQAREEERKKGRAVARQLALFDSLLDARIRLQKCVLAMNKLPNSEALPAYLEDSDSRESVDRLLAESLGLSEELFDLQEKLVNANEGFNVPARKRRKIDYDIESNPDWDEELQEGTRYFSELEASLHPHLLATLQKWSNKVLAIAPSALLPSNRTKFSSKASNQVKSAVQFVDETLLEREKLLARTRTWRGTGTRLGLSDPSQSKSLEVSGSSAADLYDDTDFYQTLLRDVIDARSGSGGAGAGLEGVMADWRTAQQQRKKARQKTIDTRASKGRRLRYGIHGKLQNFMVPAPPPGRVSWHEEQVDELFASLLGKGFPDTQADATAEECQPGMEIDVENALKDGFRVFG